MSAVLDRPIAKAARRPAARKIEPPPVTIADIRNWITTAEEKLEMAYDAAELGGPIDMLLDHINHDVILEPNRVIQRDDLTQADAKRVCEGLFPVQACLQGAIKLAEGSVLQATLEEALALLDAAQTALDPVNDAVRMLPEGGTAYDFERGRDLAIHTLKQCNYETGDYEGFRRHREPNRAQNNFVMAGLIEALCETSLHEGFAAVLTGALGLTSIDADYFGALTLAETQAGTPGEDGTGQLEDEEAAERSPEPATPSFESLGIEDGPQPMISMAIAIIQARAPEIGCELLYGAKTCAEKVKDLLGAGVGARDVLLCERASAPLGVAIAVLETALSAVDDVAVHGALKLLDLAKESLDDAVAQGDAA